MDSNNISINGNIIKIRIIMNLEVDEHTQMHNYVI